MLQTLLRIPIVSPGILVPVDVLMVLLVLAALLGPIAVRAHAGGRTRGTRRPLVRFGIPLAAAVVAAGIGLVLVWWVDDVQDAFGVSFTAVTRMWIAVAFAATGLAVAVLVQGGWRRRSLAVAALAVTLMAAGLGVNVDFGAYDTLGQALVPDPYPVGTLAHEHRPVPGAEVVDAARWTAPRDMPTHGTVESVTIPATESHFHARTALVWLPPAARVAKPPTLPVVVALSGQPGAPSDLFEAGNLGHDLDAYAAAHHGLAPIVVAPDQLGSAAANPMCVDSKALGNAGTYIMTDTVHWIHRHLDVASDANAWSVLGFSEGATCAMQFSTGHPTVFGSALAISSELAPINGSEQHTVQTAFGGSVAAWKAASPLGLMAAHAPYRDHLTVFGYGQDDTAYAARSVQLRAAAERAGMQTAMYVSPGSAHDWNTVRYVLEHGLPAIIRHTGLPAGSASATVGPAVDHPSLHLPEHRSSARPTPSAQTGERAR